MLKGKSFLVNGLLVIVSIGLTFVISEFAFRTILFGNWKVADSLRDPALYSDYFTDTEFEIFPDEYWMLYDLLNREYRSPEDPHPLLGWDGAFHPESYEHEDEDQIKGRRPVLLFGDSFSQCVEAKCFEEILNNDGAFSEQYYFLNYGVGGYGVGQIYLLAQKVIPLYEEPIVFFGFMTRDLDRSLLKFRTGQKPYFVLDGEELELKGVPIKENNWDYVSNNRPFIISYLYRYYRNGRPSFRARDKPETQRYIRKIKSLNEKILVSAHHFLESAILDCRFLVFSALYRGDREWRNGFVRDVLERNNVPYLWTKDLIEQDSNYELEGLGFYEDGNNGHPTTYQNELIAGEILKCLTDPDYPATLDEKNHERYTEIKDQFDPTKRAYYEYRMGKNPDWLKTLEEKALAEKVPLEDIIREDIEFLIGQYKESQSLSH